MRNNNSYHNLLLDPRWAAKKKVIIIRDKNKCRICGMTTDIMHVHHKQYHFIKRLQTHVSPWNYPNRLLITLCSRCHLKGHSIYKVPIKYI